MVEHDLRHGIEVFGDQRPELLGRKALGDTGEPTQVREEDGHRPPLAAKPQALGLARERRPPRD